MGGWCTIPSSIPLPQFLGGLQETHLQLLPIKLQKSCISLCLFSPVYCHPSSSHDIPQCIFFSPLITCIRACSCLVATTNARTKLGESLNVEFQNLWWVLFILLCVHAYIEHNTRDGIGMVLCKDPIMHCYNAHWTDDLGIQSITAVHS